MNHETDLTAGEGNSARATTSLEEGMFVPIDGIEQWLTIRGADRRNPALLILSGPGVSLSGLGPFFAPWEARFTLVQWDQPGAGATLERSGARGGALTVERLVRDGIAVAEHVCRHLGKPKIGLLSFSGGTMIGLTIAQRRPDLICVYAGSGQIVNWARQDSLSYRLLLHRSRRPATLRCSPSSRPSAPRRTRIRQPTP